MNDKYYFDIKNFPKQFGLGFEIAKDLKITGEFNRVVLCGMGGSSSFVDLINDYLAWDHTIKLKMEVVKGYDIPKNADSKTLFLISSYSGNTEESLNCLEQVTSRGFKYFIITSGGELGKKGELLNAPIFHIPGGIQPRLSTGYFIGGIFKILMNLGLIPDKHAEILAAAASIEASLDETLAKEIAKGMKNRVPIIYSTENNSSLALLSKIKFNENSKTQAFWNYFPELNHNEMVGFTNLIMQPYFLIYSTQFAHPRLKKRIDIFKSLMEEKGVPVKVVELKGANVLEEILMGYYLTDHITYYLAAEYGIDPEPVKMVEDFKKML